jgi:hypothetical protein
MTPAETKTFWDKGGIADPQSAKTRRLLLLTTYETLARRFRSNNDTSDTSNDDDHDDCDRSGIRNMWIGRFSRVICDEG